MDFPVYFSLVPDPGYNIADGEWDLFAGYFLYENGTAGTWGWGSVNRSIEGKVNLNSIVG